MNSSIELPIIGKMHSPFREKFGIPRQPNLVEVETYIEFIPPYQNMQAFDGIEAFSHLWLLWHFHQNKENKDQSFRTQVRPPRLGGNDKIGVFATRSMYRPAPIGLSVVTFQRLEHDGKSVRLYVTGSDLVDGTPIIDIKPYIKYSDSIPHATSAYADQPPISKQVFWSTAALEQREQIETLHPNAVDFKTLEQVLALDPTPAYHHDETRVYGMHFAAFNVKFTVNVTQIMIISLEL